MAQQRQRGDLFTAYGDVSPFAEAYRTLRISVLQGNGKAPWSVGVTGVGPSHGASTTVANLGLITAETGSRVIVLDADLYKPSVHRIFNVPNEPGLSEVLDGRATIDHALRAVPDVPLLHLFPAGTKVRNPAALLHPNTVSELLHGLRDRCDFLIVDLPSVGAVAYASFLASFLDGVLLVVQAETPRLDVEQTIKRRLQSAHILGMVLNRVPITSGDTAGYRYYNRDSS